MSVFKEKINALSTGSFKKPHKYIALLSMIIILDRKNFIENKIVFNEDFKDIFSLIFQKVAKENDRNRAHTPFFHLKTSGLVTLIPQSGKDLSQIGTIGSAGELNNCVAYAMLVPELFESLKDRSLRVEIINEIKDNLLIYHKQKEIPVATLDKNRTESFLNYLNTLQHIYGGNENALAEFQAQNPLFARIAAPHPLEEALIKDLKAGTHSIILTGHAGDGKTTLAFAVYRKLCGIPADQPLPELGNSRIRFSIDGHKALLIKDLSEQACQQHEALLNELLDEQTRSLLVSNTGALREFFLSQVQDSLQRVELESSLLTSLSREQDDGFSFRGRRFKIYNLALRDNLPLAETVLSNMLRPELWPKCASCRHKAACPVLFNRTLLADTNSPTRQRLFLAYRRLQAYGIRLTMRQLSEHLAYCLTGGLDERRLCRAEILEPCIGPRQHIYNLFFGGHHARPDSSVADMAAIRGVHEQELGAYPLPCMDKKLWHALPADAVKLGLSPLVAPFLQQLIRQGSTQENPSAGAEARLQARRLLYFCACPDSDELQKRLQQEFLQSPGVLLHAGLHGQPRLDPSLKRHLQNCLFHVLQEHFTGIHLPASSRRHSRDTLYITLNRPTPLLRQSVQTVLCTVSWLENFDLCITRRKDGRFSLQLEGRRNLRDIAPLELTIPFLDYILRRYDGAVGDLPRATFAQQLDTLKAQILRSMKDDEETQAIRLLRYCSDYQLIQDEYILDGSTLEVNRRGTY
ncbi:hypothetical protein [uncultured Desulfovibrio sp.]|uniref:hypothetical protein n=1 Tax=uncultured Desulfovibrio sp. TaxID=167968 RepID=UPI0025CDEF37|nr:hypothetical protein [uncultured Desulfovibrio sp.]